jgi:membrane protein DedA with SNARE-associated domain
MMSPDTVIAYLTSLGKNPAMMVVAIMMSTFILEDAATAGAAMLAADGVLPVSLAIIALFAGIVLGDIGLYGLGRLASRNSWVHRKLQRRVALDLRHWMGQRLVPMVFSARFIPGARLPSYTASGLLGLPFWRFTLTAAVATSLWTSLVFALIFVFGIYFHDRLGLWRWVVAGVVVLSLILISRVRRSFRAGSS